MNELKAKDCQDYEELSVVAKYRYIAYENKKQALYKLWKLREKEKVGLLCLSRTIKCLLLMIA
jgi:hypothetical protein